MKTNRIMPTTYYVIIVGFVIVIRVVYIAVEERMLAEKLGATWQEYKSETRRWL